MNLKAKYNYINQLCISKEDVIDTLNQYIKHCQNTTEERWSESKRKVILDILYKFRTCIKNTSFPKIQSKDWYYEYSWKSDGIILELLHCDEIEFDEDGTLISLTASEAIAVVEVKCNYLTVEEYAQKYEVTVMAVRQWIRRGKLRSAKKIGRDWIIPELADKPQRGYEPVTYRWDILPEELMKEFPYLQETGYINITQDERDKSRYRIDTFGKNGNHLERMYISVNEREKLELALVSESAVECEEWYSHIMYVPAKTMRYYIVEGKIMMENEVVSYEERLKLLKDNYLEICTRNYFYDEDGKYIWGIAVQLCKWFIDENNEESKVVAQLNRGLIIPAEIEFYEDDEYESAADLCDAISGDLLAVYSTIAETGGGIKTEIIKELGLDEEDAYESSILYIEDIEAEEAHYLKIFLQVFDFVTQGLPAQYCKFAVVLMNWEKENEKAKIFLECGWKIKNIDASSIVAYRKL